jgi:hypothetical protein
LAEVEEDIHEKSSGWKVYLMMEAEVIVLDGKIFK